MQQAYSVLRVVAEAQTIRMVLTSSPNELMLSELCTACASLNTEGSSGVKAVVLDFQPAGAGHQPIGAHPGGLDKACDSVRTVPQPLIAVVRGGILSAAACALVNAADLTLVAHEAVLRVSETLSSDGTLTGIAAAHLGYVSWSGPEHEIEGKLERILEVLREKSAAALRYAKASVRLGQEGAITRLEALKRVNEFYLTKVMQTEDADEGLRAFLEKRKPEWKNR